MRRHVAFHVARAVEIRRPGGRDFPQRRVVSDVRMEEGLGFGLLLLLRDIFGDKVMTWRLVGLRWREPPWMAADGGGTR